MKLKIVLLIAALTAGFGRSQAQLLNNIEKQVNQVKQPGADRRSLTNAEFVEAIKEALSKGATNGVDLVSVNNGYFKNPAIKIPFPAEAKKVESVLRTAGMGTMVDTAVESFNHAAENASKAATEIFINTIKQIPIEGAMNLVNSKQQDAATQYLKTKTTDSLVVAFKPSIQTALDKANATKYWGDIMTEYNRVPLHKEVNTDLADYVTRKAIDGLFYMIAKEEAKIRKDPTARSTQLLKRAFGSVTQ